jgi:hypothetical protein
MSQSEKIKAYLKAHGSITPMEAFSELNITKLATRMSEMISEGYKVDKVMEQRVNSDGDVVRYMRYYNVEGQA